MKEAVIKLVYSILTDVIYGFRLVNMRRYIERTLMGPIKRASKHFKVILLTGPRQVGKTTLLKEIGKNNRSYVTLDDQNMRVAAQKDPAMFIDRLELPVLIDEVQYAPEFLVCKKCVLYRRVKKLSKRLYGFKR